MLKTSLYFLVLAVIAPVLMALQLGDWERYPAHAYRDPGHFNFPCGEATRAEIVDGQIWVLTDSGVSGGWTSGLVRPST